MNKQMEMGKTMFEVMKMRKNNKQNPTNAEQAFMVWFFGKGYQNERINKANWPHNNN